MHKSSSSVVNKANIEVAIGTEFMLLNPGEALATHEVSFFAIIFVNKVLRYPPCCPHGAISYPRAQPGADSKALD